MNTDNVSRVRALRERLDHPVIDADGHLIEPAPLFNEYLQKIGGTNMLERLNEEIKRRTQVVRIFPNAQSCLRLIRALAVETHENWLEQHRYLNMEELREHKKLIMRQAA